MGRRYNLVGQKFGRLTVIKKSNTSEIKNKDKNIRVYWDCSCDCGNKTQAHTSYLTHGRKSSCGCIRVEKSKESIKKLIGSSMLPAGVGAFNVYYSQYKNGAKYKNICFDLTKKDFFEITQGHCFYCLEPPNTPHCNYKIDGTLKNNGPYISNGIDRIDSSKGYFSSNIVPCCKICNIMKQELSLEKFLEHIERLWHNIERIRNKEC